MYTNHRIDRDGHWQQFGTQPVLISVPQWANRPCNAPAWFYRVSKKLSVKADLAIYSHGLDVSGWCMSVSLILFIKLDSSSCVNWDSFCKSSHIYQTFSLPTDSPQYLFTTYHSVLTIHHIMEFFQKMEASSITIDRLQNKQTL